MKEKLIRFMYGRYGMDQLSRTLAAVAMVCVILSVFIRSQLLYWGPVLLLAIVYFRVFSKDINRRYQENARYMVIHEKALFRWNDFRQMAACRKTHRIYSCPGCGQKVRIPRERERCRSTVRTAVQALGKKAEEAPCSDMFLSINRR